LHTAALRTPEVSLVRQLDLVVLAFALPVFLAFDFPMLGYAVAAGAWLVQWTIAFLAERRIAASLASGNRRGALGTRAATMLGRVWLVALAILLVGLLAEREDGLAAAVLSAALVTAFLIAQFAGRLQDREAAP
jgi:hypothetical protein